MTTSSATTWAAKEATKTIPIVMAASADAVGDGIITNLAHPGGNITGMTFLVGHEIAGKQLELPKVFAPSAFRVAVLTNPRNESHAPVTRQLQAAAPAFGVQLQVFEARSPDQLDSAFAAMTRERAAALLVLTDAMFEPAADRQPVEPGDEDFRDYDVRDDLQSVLQSALSVLLEPDGVTGLLQEVRLELADVRIAIDDQDDRLAFAS